MTICSFFVSSPLQMLIWLKKKKMNKGFAFTWKEQILWTDKQRTWRFWKPESVALLIIHLWVKQKACDCRVKICRCVHIGWKHLKGASPSTRPLQTLRRNMFFRHFFKGKASGDISSSLTLHTADLPWHLSVRWYSGAELLLMLVVIPVFLLLWTERMYAL